MVKRVYKILGLLSFSFYERIPLSFIVKFLFFPYRSFLKYPPPKRLRLILETLGPTFIKLGQFFSTRVDLLPKEYIQELRKLQDEVPPVPLEKVLTEEIRKHLKKIFEKPIGSGSIAQVHKGILKTGEKVAVKFIKPEAEKVIKQDIKILKTLVFFLSFLPLFKKMKVKEIAEEIEALLLDELDLSREASYLELFRNFSKKVKDLYIPKVFWKLTTDKVLTTELIEGTKLTEYSKGKIANRELARKFVEIVNRMVFELKVFHGDLHPGNIFITKSGKIALVDFGIVGRLTPETASNFFLFSLGVMEKDPDLVVEALKRINVLPKEVNLTLLKREILKFLDKYYNKPLSAIDSEKIFYEELAAARKFGIVLPEELVILMKTIAHTESLARMIDPEFRLPPVLKPYLKRQLPKFLIKEARRRTIQNLLSWEALFSKLPGKLLEKEERKENLLPYLIVGSGLVLALNPSMFIPFLFVVFLFNKLLKT